MVGSEGACSIWFRYDPGIFYLAGVDNAGALTVINAYTWAIATVPAPTIVPVSFYILRPKANVEVKYLAWYLNQGPAQAAIDQIRTGAGTPIVQRAAFERLEMVVPPLEVQRGIADLAELQARERELCAHLVQATDRMQAATGRRIIEVLRRQAPRRRTS